MSTTAGPNLATVASWPMAHVRTAEIGDLGAVVDLWIREGGPTRHAGGHAEVTALFARDPQALLVAIDSGRIVGAVIAGWDGWRFHIYRLAVDRSARRQGIARQLMSAAHDRAESIGAARVDAMVAPDNSAAVAFWGAIGYELDRDARWSRLTAPSNDDIGRATERTSAAQ